MTSVTCSTPRGKIILTDVTFKCRPNDRLLITGSSGSGKSSILRIICGLWPPVKGRVTCKGGEAFFMPQKSYLTQGTLREQFTYPDKTPLTKSQLSDLLSKVNLNYILDRFNPDSISNWVNVLSGGEAQRVGMARLLSKTPHATFAILDESTSAVDEQLCAMGIAFVSVTHRPSVVKYHNCVLRLDGVGGYESSRLD